MNRKYVYFALILFLGAGLRSYFFISNLQTNSDGVLYAWIGGNIADGHGYTIARHVPAYPIIPGVFYSVFGKVFMTIILFYSLCKRRFHAQTILIAGLLKAWQKILPRSGVLIVTKTRKST